MSGQATGIELMQGRGGLRVPDIEFEMHADLRDVSRFFRVLWAANTRAGEHFDLDDVQHFDGSNYLEAADEIVVPASGSRPLTVMRYAPTHPTQRSHTRAETYQMLVPPVRAGSFRPHLTATHRSTYGSGYLGGRDLVTMTHERLGSAGVSVLKDDDSLYRRSITDRLQARLISRIMQETVDFLQED